MKILKPKFWNKKNSLISILLMPISFLYQVLIFLKKVTTKENRFKIPIICVGNIYLGGTGKTPLSILITKELTNLRRKTAIIKKYYVAHSDEHSLINDKFDNLFLDKKRKTAIQNAENENYSVAILDDGYQDCSIKKDLSILCFHENQLIGNGHTLPSGPLRQSLKTIKDAQIIVVNGTKNEIFEEKIYKISKDIKIFYTTYLPVNINRFKGKKLFAFAGIGNPNNFFELLIKNNLELAKKMSYPDHYQFKKYEIQNIEEISLKNNYDLITTEKDFHRIKNLGFKNINYLEVELQINEKEKFLNEIIKYL